MDGPLEGIESGQIKNIVLFVGDAVRYQSIGDRLINYGPTFKTIAASLHTPASFASMLSGLHVPEHGVISFSHVLPDGITSLVDLDGWNTYFSPKTGTMHEDMHRIFKMDDSTPISSADEPFIWVVRDPGGHAPYNGYNPETYDQLSETGPEYLNKVAGDSGKIQADYNDAVSSSLDRFENVVDTIRSRGIEEETLIIYTSDHGELLGEYGIIGHNHVAVPELVFVPTTFVHPSLEGGLQEQSIRHVDLYPTLLDILSGSTDERRNVSGKPIWEVTDPIGYNHFEMVFYNSGFLDSVEINVQSAWDKEGGHVFVNSSYVDTFLFYLGILVKSHKGKQIRKTNSYLTSLKQIAPGHKQLGNPTFTKQRANEIVNQAQSRSNPSNQIDLDEETRERLDDLGYI